MYFDWHVAAARMREIIAASLAGSYSSSNPVTSSPLPALNRVLEDRLQADDDSGTSSTELRRVSETDNNVKKTNICMFYLPFYDVADCTDLLNN